MRSGRWCARSRARCRCTSARSGTRRTLTRTRPRAMPTIARGRGSTTGWTEEPMAQRILGVDIGAYAVRLVELDVGFRQSRVHLLCEAPLLPPVEGETAFERGTRTLRAMLDDLE